ncbi:MAG: xylulokinase [Pseudomonadota bacterium]
MFLGLDLGTSGLRALLVSPEQQVIGEAEAAYAVSHPHPGWSEQTPGDWTEACATCIRTLVANHPAEMAALQGIGTSGQMHGATVLDAEGTPLRPCILWNDTRAHAEAAALDTAPIRALSGNIVFPGFTAPKLMWMSKHEPELFARAAKVLLPKDYLTFWLTGTYAGDMSDAAGTTWLDVGARAWSDTLLEASNMRADQMPALAEGCEGVGTVSPKRAAELGLPANIPVVAGGADNAAAACGVGALADGDGFVSLGTSGVLLLARDAFSPAPDTAVHSFCHAVPNRWYQMGVILSATDSLNWLAKITGQSPAALTSGLGPLQEPSRGLFLPYLSGERTPHNDASIRGAFTALDIADGPHDLARMVMEGVAFALRDCLEALRAAGAEPKRLLAIGGGAQSAYWVELIATVLNVPLDMPARGEFGAALGAARLAIVGATGQDPEAVMTRPQIASTVQPNTALVDAYANAYTRYRAAYPTLRSLP